MNAKALKCLVVFLTLSFCGLHHLSAHTKKPSLKLIVQIEDNQLALLMVYRPGSKGHKEGLSLLEAYSGVGIDSQRLKRIMRRVITDPVEMLFDGKKLNLDSSELKWRREGRKKFVVVMLFKRKIAPTYHTLKVKLSGKEISGRFQYVDKRKDQTTPLVMDRTRGPGENNLKLFWGNY